MSQSLRHRRRSILVAVVVLAAVGYAGAQVAARRTAPSGAGIGDSADAPLVTRVEHVVAATRDAERLYRVFRDTLGLPEVWPYRSWGRFASGGVTLGNVVLEFAAGPDAPPRAAYSSLALEPPGTTDRLLAGLVRRGISHARPNSAVRFRLWGGRSGWVTTSLPGLGAWNVFVCDYLPRAEIAAGRQGACDALAARGGGPLGVRAVREIVLEARDVDAAGRAWRALAGDTMPMQAGDPVGNGIVFARGPRLRLVRADAARIADLVLEVRSLKAARVALAARGMLGTADSQHVTLAPTAVGGLHITLVAPEADARSTAARAPCSVQPASPAATAPPQVR